MHVGSVILVEYALSGICAQEDGLVPRLDIGRVVVAVKRPSGYGKVGRKHIRLHHVPGRKLCLLAAVMTLMILLRILFPQTFS